MHQTGRSGYSRPQIRQDFLAFSTGLVLGVVCARLVHLLRKPNAHGTRDVSRGLEIPENIKGSGLHF